MNQLSNPALRSPAPKPWGGMPRANANVLRFTGIDYSLIIFFAVYQIGYSYWLSSQTVSAVLVIARWHKVIARGLRGFPIFLCIVPFMYIAMFINDSLDFVQDLLHISREAVFFVLMASFMNGIKDFHVEFDPVKAGKYIRIILLITVPLLVAQIYFLRKYVYFGIPAQFYVQDFEMIPTKLSMRFTHVRPNGLWQEPSLLSFIMLSFMMITQCFKTLGGVNKTNFALMVLCGLLCQSLSFVLYFATLMGISVYTVPTMKKYRVGVTICALIGIIALIAVGSAGFVGERLAKAGGSAGDFSLFVRIIGPFGIMPEYFTDHPLGVPFSIRLPTLMEYTGRLGIAPLEYTVNSVANMGYYYGLVGVFMMYFLLKGRDLLFGVYLFMALILQGSTLAPDMFFNFCFVAVAYKFSLQEIRKAQQLETLQARDALKGWKAGTA